METYTFDDVNVAWPTMAHQIKQLGILEDTRIGPAYTFPYPVAVTLTNPRKRVLFCQSRKANPIFHLVEAMWMLGGGLDGRGLLPFVKRFSEFMEPDGAVHGAYGYRWRKYFGYDQINYVIQLLEANPLDRRAVIQMWDPSADIRPAFKDRPCNTELMFRYHSVRKELDMLVVNRSNDLVWGMLGANVVHMSVLHEYVAATLGMTLGRMTTVTNNLHAYKDVLDKHMPLDYNKYTETYDSLHLKVSPLDGGFMLADEVNEQLDELQGRFNAMTQLMERQPETWMHNDTLQGDGSSWFWDAVVYPAICLRSMQLSGSDLTDIKTHLDGEGAGPDFDWSYAIGKHVERTTK